MAKQPEDTKTPDMIGEPKRRGRPATGKAMTAAERKRAQRERDREAFWKCTPAGEMSTTGLLESLAYAVNRGLSIDAKAIADELVKRAEKTAMANGTLEQNTSSE